MKDKEMEIINPYDIYIDPKSRGFIPRWWHKFIFWRKFCEWEIRREYKTRWNLTRTK